MKRIQFYVEDKKFEEIRLHAENAHRSAGNLALHALDQYMRRYSIKDEDKDMGIKSV